MKNVFVLTTGRSGSKTLAAALSHLPGWTVGHETNAHLHGPERLDYPDNHIEVDNRLAWMLGPLPGLYPDARYVWLRRDPEAVVRSYNRRWGVTGGIMPAFDSGILLRPRQHQRRMVDEDYIDTARFMVRIMEANIWSFLLARPPGSDLGTIWIEQPKPGFQHVWRWLALGYGGPPDEALAEFDVIRDRTGD